MKVPCKVCAQFLDPVWVEVGVDAHPSCESDFECPHGVERGPRYCPFCRKTNPGLTAPIALEKARKPVERQVVLVGAEHPQTSQLAAQRALPSSGSKRRLVLDAIRESGDGLCDWQLERLLEWKHESASACRRSLVKDGWVQDSGRVRPVPDTGNAAIGWVTA
jgi:hypothetical protein